MVNNTILVTKFILNFLINLILNFFINFVLTFTKTSRNERQGDYDYFFLKPKYSISACKFASTELLANLMRQYKEDIEKYYDEYYSRNWIYIFFVKFFAEIIQNPNCDEETFKKAVESSVKLNLNWPMVYVAIRNSRFFSNEILKWVLKNSQDYAYIKRLLSEKWLFSVRFSKFTKMCIYLLSYDSR